MAIAARDRLTIIRADLMEYAETLTRHYGRQLAKCREPDFDSELSARLYASAYTAWECHGIAIGLGPMDTGQRAAREIERIALPLSRSINADRDRIPDGAVPVGPSFRLGAGR